MGSFVFYESFSDAINELKPADRLKVYDSITAYVFKGKEPNLSGVSKAIFALIKPQLDANKVRYENGLKGGAPKGNSNARKQPTVESKKQPTVESEKQPTVEKEEHLKTTDGCLQKQPNENVNENVNENENVKESKRKNPPSPKHQHGEYGHVFLTDDELNKLKSEFGESRTEEAIRYLDEYIADKGYKSKNHYLAMRRWVFNALDERKAKKPENRLGTFGAYKQTSTDEEWEELMNWGGSDGI